MTIILLLLIIVLATAGVLLLQASRRETKAALLRNEETSRRASEAEIALAQQSAAERARLDAEPDRAELAEIYRGVAAEAAQTQSEQVQREGESRFKNIEDQARIRREKEAQATQKVLATLSKRLEDMESERTKDSATVAGLVTSLTNANEGLRRETHDLTSALKDNRVRGNWGEAQLRRVLEMSGMLKHVDFVEQKAQQGDQTGRPDVTVHLSNDRVIVIDAKAPLAGYVEAHNADDQASAQLHLRSFAKAVRDRIKELADREYSRNDHTLDLVILYLPGECFLSAALDTDPELLEVARSKGILLSSPTSLMAILQGVQTGWRDRQVSEQATEIALLGKTLHERLAKYGDHFQKVGKNLDRAISAYNEAVGSMDSRVLPAARKLAESGADSGAMLTPGSLVDTVAQKSRASVAQKPKASELTEGDPEQGQALSTSGESIDLRRQPEHRLRAEAEL